MQKGKGKRIFSKGINDHGFSLVEVLISVVILALIATPLLKQFVTVYKVNSKSNNFQKETLLAQSLLEDIKAKTFIEIVSEYEESTAHTSNPNEIYYLEKKDIHYSGKKYDVLITMDATPYRVENPANPSGEKIGYNTFQMPIIEDINIPKNILAIESYETDLAVAALYGNHVNYIAEQRELHKDDLTFAITEAAPSDIQEKLTKQIQIEIKKTDGIVKVKVEFDFSCPAIEGCENETYTVTDKTFHTSLGDVYVFYYPTYSDNLSITKDVTITEDVDIYVVRQEPKNAITPIPETLIGALPLGVNLYSNVKYGVNSNSLVKKDVAQNRIYDVKVQIYPAGAEFQAEELLVEFHSTKEE